MEIVDNCRLEWDKARGVLYVHSGETGGTILRICRLEPQPDLPCLQYGHMVDITGPFENVSYPLVSYGPPVRSREKETM